MKNNKDKVTEDKKDYYSRICGDCGSKIFYTWRTDFYTARKNNRKCTKCSNSKETRFKKGHNLNDIYSKREFSLDKLLDETPESFYWLGFLIADGSFRDNRFELSLSEKDKEHLVKFANFIGFNKELSYREKTKSYRLSFNNKYSIPVVMEKYGIVRNKTYNPIDFSIFEKYPKELIMSMLIGIIDGDGYIEHVGFYDSFSINITAHKSWFDFYNNLVLNIGIPFRIYKLNNSNVLRISIQQKEYVSKILAVTNEYILPILKRKWGFINYDLSDLKESFNYLIKDIIEYYLINGIKSKEIAKNCGITYSTVTRIKNEKFPNTKWTYININKTIKNKLHNSLEQALDVNKKLNSLIDENVIIKFYNDYNK